MKIECSNCGELVFARNGKCEECGEDLSSILVDDTYNGISQEECCLNCLFYDISSVIQCPVLAKKWDRDKIDIDCPDSMYCENFRSL